MNFPNFLNLELFDNKITIEIDKKACSLNKNDELQFVINLLSENSNIKEIKENYELKKTIVHLIELNDSSILQIGRFGVSYYNNMEEFILIAVEKNKKANQNFNISNFYPYKKYMNLIK